MTTALICGLLIIVNKMFEYIQKAIFSNLIYESRYLLLIEGLWTTLVLSVVAFTVGTLLAALLCLGNGSKCSWVRHTVNAFVGVIVKLPSLVLLMIFFYLIFINANINSVTVAIIAFSIKSACHLSVMFRSAVDSVESGEIEAARTLGMSKVMVFFKIILPQAIHQVMPLYTTQFIITMQETSVVSLVAIMDLTRASNIITSRTMDPFIAVIITSVAYVTLGFLANYLLKLFDSQKHISGKDWAVK